jgi:prophage regulatory protein
LNGKPEKFLRLSEVQNRIPVSRSTIYLRLSHGEFPKPYSLGARVVAWLESDIDAWVAAQIITGRAGARVSLA